MTRRFTTPVLVAVLALAASAGGDETSAPPAAPRAPETQAGAGAASPSAPRSAARPDYLALLEVAHAGELQGVVGELLEWTPARVVEAAHKVADDPSVPPFFFKVAVLVHTPRPRSSPSSRTTRSAPRRTGAPPPCSFR